MPTRRNFLQLGAAAAAAVALAPVLAGCGPAGNADDYEALADDLRRPVARPAPAAAPDLRELVRLATLAPSGHNSQPWKFRLAPGRLELHPDKARRLPAVDPDDRELWMSLGAALENLLVAAEHLGYHPEATYHLGGTAADHVAVTLEPTGAAPAAAAGPLAAILARQSTRRPFDGRAVPTPQLAQLMAAGTGAGVVPLLFAGPAMEPLLEYVKAGNARQMGDEAFKAELLDWVRFNDGQALATRDGLLGRAAGHSAVPRWLGRLLGGTSLNARTQDATDAANVRSSAGMLLFASARNDPAAWLDTGRAHERFALRATALGLKYSYLNQPCEVPELRAQLQAHLGLGGAWPQLLTRFGHAPAMPRSLRRPVSAVLLDA